MTADAGKPATGVDHAYDAIDRAIKAFELSDRARLNPDGDTVRKRVREILLAIWHAGRADAFIAMAMTIDQANGDDSRAQSCDELGDMAADRFIRAKEALNSVFPGMGDRT